jgi:hypothetical protein
MVLVLPALNIYKLKGHLDLVHHFWGVLQALNPYIKGTRHTRVSLGLGEGFSNVPAGNCATEAEQPSRQKVYWSCCCTTAYRAMIYGCKPGTLTSHSLPRRHPCRVGIHTGT